MDSHLKERLATLKTHSEARKTIVDFLQDRLKMVNAKFIECNPDSFSEQKGRALELNNLIKEFQRD